MLASSGPIYTGANLPLSPSIAKVITVNGSLRSAAYRNRRSGLSASGMLVGDGASAPGISIFSISSTSPLARSNASTEMLGSPQFETYTTVSGFSCAIAATAFSALQIAGGARGGAFGAALHPVRRLRHVRDIDPRRPRPGQDARDVQIGDGEMLAEQIGLVRDRLVEHHQRPAEFALALVGQRRIALVLGQQRAVEHRGQHRRSISVIPQKLHCQVSASSSKRIG